MGIQGTQTDDEDTVQEGDVTALCNTVIVRCLLSEGDFEEMKKRYKQLLTYIKVTDTWNGVYCNVYVCVVCMWCRMQ